MERTISCPHINLNISRNNSNLLPIIKLRKNNSCLINTNEDLLRKQRQAKSFSCHDMNYKGVTNALCNGIKTYKMRNYISLPEISHTATTSSNCLISKGLFSCQLNKPKSSDDLKILALSDNADLIQTKETIIEKSVSLNDLNTHNVRQNNYVDKQRSISCPDFETYSGQESTHFDMLKNIDHLDIEVDKRWSKLKGHTSHLQVKTDRKSLRNASASTHATGTLFHIIIFYLPFYFLL